MADYYKQAIIETLNELSENQLNFLYALMEELDMGTNNE